MTLIPYIIFNGNCEEALNFYAKALGGEIKGLMRFEGTPAANMSDDKQKVLHSNFEAKGITFMASDSGNMQTGATNSGMVHLSLDFDNEGEMSNVFTKLSEGGNVTMPIDDTFWGARFGMLTDRFGINWMFNHDKQRQ